MTGDRRSREKLGIPSPGGAGARGRRASRPRGRRCGRASHGDRRLPGRQPVRVLGPAAGLAARTRAAGVPRRRPGLDHVACARRAGAGRITRAGLRRLERINRLPHQPLRSLGDRLSGGGEDRATRSLWRRHQERLRAAVRGLKVGPPRSDLPRRDPVGAARRAGSAAAGRRWSRPAAWRRSGWSQAFELRPRRPQPRACRSSHRVGHAADLHRAAADTARGRARVRSDQPLSAAGQGQRPGRQRGARAAASLSRRGRTLFARARRRSSSRSRRSARTAPRPA